MNEDQIRAHIAARRKEHNDLIALDKHIHELHETCGLQESTMKDIQAKISSRMAACDMSIRDHEKLLPQP